MFPPRRYEGGKSARLSRKVPFMGKQVSPIWGSKSVSEINFLPSAASATTRIPHNISSVAGLVPVPYLAVYSATQHYISALTQAIAQEYSGLGVVIQEVRSLSHRKPGFLYRVCPLGRPWAG